MHMRATARRGRQAIPSPLCRWSGFGLTLAGSGSAENHPSRRRRAFYTLRDACPTALRRAPKPGFPKGACPLAVPRQSLGLRFPLFRQRHGRRMRMPLPYHPHRNQAEGCPAGRLKPSSRSSAVVRTHRHEDRSFRQDRHRQRFDRRHRAGHRPGAGGIGRARRGQRAQRQAGAGRRRGAAPGRAGRDRGRHRGRPCQRGGARTC